MDVLEGKQKPAEAPKEAKKKQKQPPQQPQPQPQQTEAEPNKTAAEQAEDEVKGFGLKAAAKTLCKPFDHPELPAGTKCFACARAAKVWALWGRSY